MTDQITLTAAEISFLIAAVDPASQTVAADLVGLTPEERTGPVKAAGLASLTARGLAAPAGENVHLAGPAAAVATGLTQATMIIQLGLVAANPERADGTMIFANETVRFLIAPRLNRCYDITGLDRTRDLREPILHVVQTFLAQHRPGVASLRIEHGPDPATLGRRLITTATDLAPGFGWVTVGVGPDNTWTFADVFEQDARNGDQAQALDRLRRVLSDLLDLPVGSPAV
jgi:hypothetical protein